MGGSRIDSNIISALGWISSIRCYRGSSVSHNKFDRNSQLMQINNLTLSTGDSVSYNLLTGLAAEIQTIPQAGTSSINYDTLTRSYSFIKNITQLNGHIQNCRIDSSRSGYNMIDLKDADIFNATDISITDVVLQGVTLNLSGFHHNISNETIINGSGAFTASYSFFNNPLSTGQPILLNLIPPGFSVTKLIITSSGSITNGSTLTIDLSGGDTSLINILTDSLNRSNYYWTGVSKAATSNQCLSVSPNSTINSGSLNVYLEIVNLAAPTSRVIFIK